MSIIVCCSFVVDFSSVMKSFSLNETKSILFWTVESNITRENDRNYQI